MFRGDDRVSHPENRVDPRRINFYFFSGAFYPHLELGAFRSSDPIFLLLDYGILPVQILLVQIVKQPVGVFRHPKNPLAQFFLHDFRAASFTKASFQILVRQDRLARGAPIHRLVRFISQTLLEKLEEYPLRPFIIIFVRGVYLPVPIVSEPEFFQLALEGRDIFFNRHAGMYFVFDGIVFRRQTERVPTHRMEDAASLKHHEARIYVRSDIALGMADMEPGSRRVREHIQRVKFLFSRIVLIETRFLPFFLPSLFDFYRIVLFHIFEVIYSAIYGRYKRFPTGRRSSPDRLLLAPEKHTRRYPERTQCRHLPVPFLFPPLFLRRSLPLPP